MRTSSCTRENGFAATRITIMAAAVTILIIGSTGCGSEKYEGVPREAPPPPPVASPAPGSPHNATVPANDATDPQAPGRDGSPATPAPTVERKIIRNASMTVRVERLDTAEARVGALAEASGGFVASSSRSQAAGSSRSGAITVRIPAERFESTMAALRSLGEVGYEEIATNDVTQEHIDLTARLKTQQELEARLLGLLKEKSGRLEEVIAVEEKLASVRAGIEGLQGQLRYMNNQVAMSTIAISLFEPGAVGSSSETFGGRMERAFDNGMEGLVDLIGTSITVVIALLPIIIGAAIIVFAVVRPLRRRARARKAAREGAGTQ